MMMMIMLLTALKFFIFLDVSLDGSL